MKTSVLQQVKRLRLPLLPRACRAGAPSAARSHCRCPLLPLRLPCWLPRPSLVPRVRHPLSCRVHWGSSSSGQGPGVSLLTQVPSSASQGQKKVWPMLILPSCPPRRGTSHPSPCLWATPVARPEGSPFVWPRRAPAWQDGPLLGLLSGLRTLWTRWHSPALPGAVLASVLLGVSAPSPLTLSLTQPGAGCSCRSLGKDVAGAMGLVPWAPWVISGFYRGWEDQTCGLVMWLSSGPLSKVRPRLETVSWLLPRFTGP